MKAIFITTFWMEVDDHDEAGYIAVEGEKAARLNLLHAFEQQGLSAEELEGRFGYLGGSYWLLDEDKVMG